MKIVKKSKLKSWLLISVIFIVSACNVASEDESNSVNETSENGLITTAEAAENESDDTENESDDAIEMSLQTDYIYLPPPQNDGDMSVERALYTRRSRREFQDEALSLEQVSQILWAAYGITSPVPDNPSLRGGFRTTPSAGALYPLEIYIVVGNIDGLEPGVYRYISAYHRIIQVVYEDIRNELYEAASNQVMVREAPMSVFYSAVFERTTERYGERGIMYAYFEIGHSAQNIYLQAQSLGLGTCAIGAFTNDIVRQLLNLPDDEEPLYLMPIGYYY